MIAADTQGNVSAEIIGKARRGGYDAVFLGRQDPSGIVDTLLGGVAFKVAEGLDVRAVCVVRVPG